MADMTDRMASPPPTEDYDLFEQDLRADYIRDDERWSTASQVRDWLIIFAVGLFVFGWMFVVFLMEPGIR
jgi:hypothetical protein